MKKLNLLMAIGLVLMLGLSKNVQSCTNFLVSKGASADGSVMITYSADAGGFMEPFYFAPARDWAAGDSIAIYEWDTGLFLGKIKQVAHTYKVIGNMNEFQVSIGETTFTGRKELGDANGILDYGSLMYIALQRAKTAREAITIMAQLVSEYGYASTGESMSVADKNEVWIFEIIGKGKGNKGMVWAAARVPEGFVCAHANQARIRKINFNDKENWMWANDVVSFAKEKGFFNANGKDEDFSFTDAYCPPDPTSLLLCEGRVWSFFRRIAPSQTFSEDYWRAVRGAEPYPLFVKPDKKLTPKDMMAMMRDHFEGTAYDMTKGFAAGPYGCPYRWKPLFFQVDGDTINKYGWERPISSQQSAFSFVAQSRSWLPDEVGGLFWYGVDEAYSSCYIPFYMGMTDVPKAFTIGSITQFDWNSPFWVFNLVANYAYGMYSIIIEDIKKVQTELEGDALAMTPYIEKTALDIGRTDKVLMQKFLTNYSVSTAEKTVERWQELGKYVFARYNDRYINDMKDNGRSPHGAAYSNDFYKRSVQDKPGYYDVKWQDPPKKKKGK